MCVKENILNYFFYQQNLIYIGILMLTSVNQFGKDDNLLLHLTNERK